MSRVRSNRLTEFTEGAGVTIDDPRFASGPWVDVTSEDYGATGDGATNDRTSITNADTAAVADSIGLLFRPGTYKVSSNLTISSRCHFLPGAMLSPDTGITVTLSAGLFPTGPYQIFTGLGTVVFGDGAQPVVLPQWFVGTRASDKIRNACGSIGPTSGSPGAPAIIDCRHFTDTQYLVNGSTDFFSQYDRTPMTFYWGPNTFFVSAVQQIHSHHRHVFDGTTFIMKDTSGVRVTGTKLWNVRSHSTTAAITASNRTFTLANDFVASLWTEAGGAISVFGYAPQGGRDNTTLDGAHNNSITTITVADTTGFLSAGAIRIGTEVITYTATTATEFTGCTRGAYGTTAGTYSGGEDVDRAVYRSFRIATYDSSTRVGTFEDEDPVSGFTATAVPVQIGAVDWSLDGSAVMDGNMDTGSDDALNPVGLQSLYGRKGYVGPGITWQNWDHTGVYIAQGREMSVRGRYRYNGRAGSALGAHVWFFGGTRDSTADVDLIIGGYLGVGIDDRSTTAQDLDDVSDGNTVRIRVALDCARPAYIAGSNRNAVIVEVADNYSVYAANIEADQWVTAPTPSENIIEVRTDNPKAGATACIRLEGCSGGNNTFILPRGSTLSDVSSASTGNHIEHHRHGVSADNGDTSPTFTMADEIEQRFDTILSANRTVTLPTGYYGATFRITRTGLGAFTLNVGGLKTIPSATAAFVDVAHDGTAWKLSGYGAL